MIPKFRIFWLYSCSLSRSAWCRLDSSHAQTNWCEPANRGWGLGACDSGTANQLNLEVIYKSNRVVPENHSLLSAITFPMPVSSDDPLDEVLRPPPDETPEQRELRLEREAEAKRISLAIDASIKAERQARRKKRIVRLLLLGQSESGM